MNERRQALTNTAESSRPKSTTRRRPARSSKEIREALRAGYDTRRCGNPDCLNVVAWKFGRGRPSRFCSNNCNQRAEDVALRLTDLLRVELRLQASKTGRDAKRAHDPEVKRLRWLLQPYVQAEFAHWPSVFPEVDTQHGDTLWGLAIEHLGDGMRYREIVALNPGLDPMGSLLGMRLRLPVDAVGV